MSGVAFAPSPAELAADLRAARRRVQDLERERDALLHEVATLKPALAASQGQIAQVTAERDEARGREELARAATLAHQAVMAASLPERIHLTALVEALSSWKPGRLLSLELGPWLRSLTVKDLPPGPYRRHVEEAVTLLGRLGRVPLLILVHEGATVQPMLLSFTPGTPDEMRAQLEAALPSTKTLCEDRPLTHKRHKRALTTIGTVTAVEGDRVRCEAEGLALSLPRECLPADAALGQRFTLTVIIEGGALPAEAGAR